MYVAIYILLGGIYFFYFSPRRHFCKFKVREHAHVRHSVLQHATPNTTHMSGVFYRDLCGRRGRAKLTASEYDETPWSARTWMAFVTQRLSVAAQLSMAQLSMAEALGLSVAADPRAQ